MNRSFGTSSLPRLDQYEALRKSADVYLGGTGMFSWSPFASSSRCRSQVSLPLGALAQPGVLVAKRGQVRNMLGRR